MIQPSSITEERWPKSCCASSSIAVASPAGQAMDSALRLQDALGPEDVRAPLLERVVRG